jgi:hypothetical protein
MIAASMWKACGALAMVVACFWPVGAKADQPTPAPASSPLPAPSPAAAAGYPCNNLNAYVSRPSVTNSACPVPPHQWMIETGYTNTATVGAGSNSGTNVPQALIKTGIGPRIEFDLLPPSMQKTNNGISTLSGTSDIGFGFKALLGYSQRATYGVSVLATLPCGSAAFTSGANTYTLDLNGTYAVNGRFSLFGTAAFNSLAGTDARGNLARFDSFIPSLGATYSLPSNWSLYAEGAMFNPVALGAGNSRLIDYGIAKNVGSRLQLDAEVGNSLNALNASRFHYFGVGASFLFGPL